MFFVYLFIFFVTVAHGTILNCCSKANFMGRSYERLGSMKLTVDEVPMYISVGSSTNNGNLVQMSWEITEDTVRPTLQEVKTMELRINNEPTIMTEEIAAGEDVKDGSTVCPSEMKWTSSVGNSTTDLHDWTCVDNNQCIDQGEFCKVNAITNRCTTLNKICCHTCEEWRKNMTATDTATSTMPSVIIENTTTIKVPETTLLTTNTTTSTNASTSTQSSTPTQSSTTSSSAGHTFSVLPFSIFILFLVLST